MADYLVVRTNVSPFYRVLDANASFADVPDLPAIPSQSGPGTMSWNDHRRIMALPSGYTTPARIDLLDTDTWTMLDPIAPAGAVSFCAFDPSGQYLAVGQADGAFYVLDADAAWSIVTGSSKAFGSEITGIAWHPAGAWVAIGRPFAPAYHILNAATWDEVGSLPEVSATGRRLQWSPDGAMLAIPHDNAPRLTVLNTGTWTVVESTPAPGNVQRDLTWSPSGGKLVLAGDHSPFVRMIDTSTWGQIRTLSTAGPGWRAQWEPDGDRIAFIDRVSTTYYLRMHDDALAANVAAPSIASLLSDLVWVGYAPIGGAGTFTATAPIRVTVTSNEITATAPIRVQVVEERTATAGLRVRVLSASVLAGLNGAGGWPAAPNGKWQAHVWIGAVDFSARVRGEISIQRAVDEAATAAFEFLPAAALEPMALVRQPVRITFAQAGGLNAQLMFMGVIDVAEIDLTFGLIKCRCTDQLQEVVANTPREWIDAQVGGRWSEHVSGIPADNWAYFEARIKSVPKSIALDVRRQPQVLPWRNLARLVTIRDNDPLNESISVDLPSSVQMRTRVTVRLQYRYTRLRVRGAVATWSQPFSFFAAYDPNTGLRLRQWMRTGMIQDAADRLSGWSRTQPITITHPPPGVYFSNPPTFGGYFLPAYLVNDLAMAFSARYMTRWTQTVTESYAVTLRLPALEALIGAQVPEEFGANIVAERAPERWAADYNVPPVLTPPAIGDVAQAWQPEGADQQARDEAMLALMAQAWVRLYAANRTGRVRCALPLRPDLWFDVWATLDTARITAAGAVVEIEHRMSVHSGEAVTQIGIAVGLPGNADAVMPTFEVPALGAEDTTRPLSAYSVEVGTYVGGDPASLPFDQDTMIGFITNTDRQGQLGADGYQYYPHSLSMRAPPIDEIDLDPLVVPAEQVIDVAIPTDLLETT